jgi:hypothetical protein
MVIFFPKNENIMTKYSILIFCTLTKKNAQQNHHAQIPQYHSSFTISLSYDTYKPRVLAIKWTQKWITCKKVGPTTMMQCPRAIQWLKTTRQWLWNEGKKEFEMLIWTSILFQMLHELFSFFQKKRNGGNHSLLFLLVLSFWKRTYTMCEGFVYFWHLLSSFKESCNWAQSAH